MTTALAPALAPSLAPSPAPAARTRTKKVRRSRSPAKSRAEAGVLRVDPVGHRMNPGKEREAWALIGRYRRVAVLIGREQHRLFLATGRLRKQYRSPDEDYLAKVAGAANIVQMVRFQVVEMLESFWSNRGNDFRDLVSENRRLKTITPETAHQLYTLNAHRAWFVDPAPLKRGTDGGDLPPVPVRMKDGAEIPRTVRRMAAEMMRAVLAKHGLPDLSRINPRLDPRAVTFVSFEELGGRTSFPLWVTLPTSVPFKTMRVPLVTSGRFERRLAEGAVLRGSVQLNEVEDRRGRKRLVIGLITDAAVPAAISRVTYQPRTDVLALDFGLRTLFGTDRGDLVGRGFLAKLREYDATLTALAAYRQRHGLVSKSPRYRRHVARLRGFLESEINRVLNRLVEVHAPRHLVVERLDFRNQHLTKRLNRLVSNCGRRVIRAKLQDFEQRLGVTHEEVNPAYSSQTCSNPACEYVDERNRQGEQFACRLCGNTLHADVNAPRTLRARRSRPEEGDVTLHRSVVLRALVVRVEARHPRRSERWSGPLGRSGDPRTTGRYYQGPPGTVIASRSSPGAVASGAQRR